MKDQLLHWVLLFLAGTLIGLFIALAVAPIREGFNPETGFIIEDVFDISRRSYCIGWVAGANAAVNCVTTDCEWTQEYATARLAADSVWFSKRMNIPPK